ncbi:SMP-30/gluconolactonase/LRE family protein [Pseudoduganella sp. R-34]|uniref:NHL repeat-containing protein n=1 Tax=Pseudoduganella sp. R-34 TaxID=3404062 RepID=UPI003CF8AC17
MRTSIKLTVFAAAALAIAGAGGYFYYSSPANTVAARLPELVKRGPAPTERAWPARLETLLDAGLADPYGIAADKQGNVYFSDGGEKNTVSVLARDGSVRVLAGGIEGYRDGAGVAAAFNTPSGIALDKQGNVYVADTGNHVIRKIAVDGTVSTLAGSGIAGFANGQGAQAQFNGPVGVAVDAAGAVYVADTYNDRIRKIAPDGTVTTLAGSGRPGFVDGMGEGAQFDTPCGIALGKDGIYIADTSNDAVRRINNDGSVVTIAVAPELEKEPLLRRPMALAVTHDGFVYIAVSSRGRLLQLAPDGNLAGMPDAARPADPVTGIDGNIQLYGPRSLALAADGTLVIADGSAQRLHRVVHAGAGAAPAQPAAQVAKALSSSPGVQAGAPLIGAAHAAEPMPPAGAPAAAASDLMARRNEGPMPWPVLPQNQPHEVVGLMGEVRGSYDGDSRHHFHAGLDVQADVGSSVHVVEKAKVSDPLPNWAYGSLGEGINLGTTSYIHMKVGRDKKNRALDDRFQLLLNDQGKPERVRVRRGTRFYVGEQLGVVNQMAHVHLNLYDHGRVVNPLALPFPGLRDTIAPVIQGIALYDASDKRLPARKGKRLEVARILGEVNVVVDAFDQMDGNLARRRLGLYKLGYQLLQADGTPVAGYEQPRIMQTYDQLPKQREAVKVVYSADSGITVYGSKATRFTYSLLSHLSEGEVVPGRWQVSELAPGDYTLRIYAADYAGNTATSGRDLALTVN